MRLALIESVDAEVERQRRDVRMRLSVARARAESIEGWLDSPWIWAVLGPERLGRIKDALEELTTALSEEDLRGI